MKHFKVFFIHDGKLPWESSDRSQWVVNAISTKDAIEKVIVEVRSDRWDAENFPENLNPEDFGAVVIEDVYRIE